MYIFCLIYIFQIRKLKKNVLSNKSVQSKQNTWAYLFMLSFIFSALTTKEICALPEETGRCRAYIRKFHYNPESKTCEEFTYGGCGGNRNNFDTEAQCLQFCREDTPVRVTPRPDDRQRRMYKHTFNWISTEFETLSMIWMKKCADQWLLFEYVQYRLLNLKNEILCFQSLSVRWAQMLAPVLEWSPNTATTLKHLSANPSLMVVALETTTTSSRRKNVNSTAVCVKAEEVEVGRAL